MDSRLTLFQILLNFARIQSKALGKYFLSHVFKTVLDMDRLENSNTKVKTHRIRVLPYQLAEEDYLS